MSTRFALRLTDEDKAQIATIRYCFDCKDDTAAIRLALAMLSDTLEKCGRKKERRKNMT